jgi:hypothetical protein
MTSNQRLSIVLALTMAGFAAGLSPAMAQQQSQEVSFFSRLFGPASPPQPTTRVAVQEERRVIETTRPIRVFVHGLAF